MSGEEENSQNDLFDNGQLPPQNQNLPTNNQITNLPNYPGPRWNGVAEKFSTYKLHFKLFVDGVDPYLVTVLESGPYVPYVTTVFTAQTATTPAVTRTSAKLKDQWSDEDRRLVHLDTRLRNMILASIPESMVTALLPYQTSKTMWEEIVNQNEGCSKTVKAQKVALNKSYENFFALSTETLSETYLRFKSLLAEMEVVGLKKDNETLLEKFCDVLPTKHEAIIGTMRNSGSLYTHTLATLHGAFKHDEENRAKRIIDERNAFANSSSGQYVIPGHSQITSASSTALVASSEIKNFTPTQSVGGNPFLSMRNMMADLYDSGLLENITTDEIETEGDDLVCMVAKTFNRFKSRSRRFGQNKASVDKSNLTCFRCGKKGHFMKECPLNHPSASQFQMKPHYASSSSAPVHHPFQSKAEDAYKTKYKQLKAHFAQVSQELNDKLSKATTAPCMLAKDNEGKWVDSDDSSIDGDDDTEIVNLCFMAYDVTPGEPPKHIVKDDIGNGRWVEIVMKKVNDYGKMEESEEKVDMYCSIHRDLTFASTSCTEATNLANSCSTELNSVRTQLKCKRISILSCKLNLLPMSL